MCARSDVGTSERKYPEEPRVVRTEGWRWAEHAALRQARKRGLTQKTPLTKTPWCFWRCLCRVSRLGHSSGLQTPLSGAVQNPSACAAAAPRPPLSTALNPCCCCLPLTHLRVNEANWSSSRDYWPHSLSQKRWQHFNYSCALVCIKKAL